MKFDELFDDAQAESEPTFVVPEITGGVAARIKLSEKGLEEFFQRCIPSR